MNDRKQYTSDFKREAVRLLNEGGVSLSAASLQLGVHRSLLGKWKRQHQMEAHVASSGSGSETGRVSKMMLCGIGLEQAAS